ncbi:MAG: hypothetical protein QNJ92_06770 [Alphaproteobacteria bacterium]|nr:hypothetical protein [Alphaproteobacteria bacterium]
MSGMNCLSYWFPKLQDAGLPMPRTEIVHMPDPAKRAAYSILNAEAPAGEDNEALGQCIDEIALRAGEIGYPVFLRTGHTSGKHDWERTCCLTSAEHIDSHVASLVEFSECAGILGLPYDVWAVREMLPTKPIGVCPGYGNMPICREFRVFTTDGDILCWHPYWPPEALAHGGAVYRPGEVAENVAAWTPDERREILGLAQSVGRLLGGCWSVDVLETERGWYVTDMARGQDSWHWPGCAVGEAIGP